ncbi:MAG: peptidase S24, partial [Bacteroidota bacterium]
IREIWYVRAKISPFLPSPTNLNRYMREEISDMKATILQQSKLIENLTQTLDSVLAQRVEKS